LADVDNALRVIKYVAILGYCYSSCDVVETRIHGIRVIADLNRHDPINPNRDKTVQYDRTASGRLTERDESNCLQVLGGVMSNVEIHWTGPWPVLHIVRTPRPPPEERHDDGIEFHAPQSMCASIPAWCYSLSGYPDTQDSLESQPI